MKKNLLPLLLLIFSGFFSSTIQASPSRSNAVSFFTLAQNDSQSLEDAAQKIKQQTGGRILSAKTMTVKGQKIHKIKVLLPSGKVRIFKVIAN